MSTQQATALPTAEESRRAELSRLVHRLRLSNGVALSSLWIVASLVALLFIAIIVLLLAQGISYLFRPDFYGTGNAGIGPELFNTFYILILTQLFLFPIALAAAVYLIEYAPQGKLVTTIHFAAETLAGVPSIVLGLFGVIAFGIYAHMGTSRLAGALTLLCLNLPLALRLFEDALTSVSRDLREGSLALGSTRWHMVRTVVLPSALPGIITGLILSAGKIIGEAAALIFTMGANNPASGVFTLNPLIGSDNLTVHLWYILTQGLGSTGLTASQTNQVAAGSAALLIVILLLINVTARAIGRTIQRRATAA
ncbi:MAG TPA: phosphate ABC transporter permease PstA [Ktedonosporobacter sp.]|jgi:phosphate transport system permease protein|nr:phosphate ABC transporter permease PstA [Ktedonosporobacter sp.]